MSDEDRELDFIRRQLRSALPPWNDAESAELQVDLWPRMLRRLEEISRERQLDEATVRELLRRMRAGEEV